MVCIRSCVLGLFAFASLASAASPSRVERRSSDLTKRGKSLITEITGSTSSVKSLTKEVLGVVSGDDVSLTTVSAYLATVVNTVETLAEEVVELAVDDVVGVVVVDVAVVLKELLTAVDELVAGLLAEVEDVTGLEAIVEGLKVDLAGPIGQILTGLEGVLAGVLHLVGEVVVTIANVLGLGDVLGLVNLK